MLAFQIMIYDFIRLLNCNTKPEHDIICFEIFRFGEIASS